MVDTCIFDLGGVYMKGKFRDFESKSCEILGIENSHDSSCEVVFDRDYNKERTSPIRIFSLGELVPMFNKYEDVVRKMMKSG